MAWMLVHKECSWRRPNSKFSFNAKPGGPQRWPRAFVDYCVSKGAAAEVAPLNKAQAALLLRANKKSL